jgi:hypothetical protein
MSYNDGLGTNNYNKYYNNILNKLCGSVVVILIYINLSIFLKEKKA